MKKAANTIRPTYLEVKRDITRNPQRKHFSHYEIVVDEGLAGSPVPSCLGAAAEGGPILDINSPLKSQAEGGQAEQRLKAIKCKCKKSWCPSCSKKTVIEPLVQRFEGWEWDRVRMITLTVDRRHFDGPEQAFDEIQAQKSISNLFRNLSRTEKKDIQDWVRVLEWHRDGFPHWHILVLMGSRGIASQIGGDPLRTYWCHGAVRESYMKSAAHWGRFTGYFGKMGYFEDKKGKQHQVSLPEWARNRSQRIRRIGAMHRKDQQKEKTIRQKADAPVSVEEKIDRLGDWFDAAYHRDIVTEGEKLDRCGTAVDIYYGPDWSSFWGRAHVRYNDFLRGVVGSFEPGQGYVFYLSSDKVSDFVSHWHVS